MKKFALLTLAAFLPCLAGYAQEIKYPEKYKAEFAAADRTVVPGMDRAPLIALPFDAPDEFSTSAAAAAGGVPFFIDPGIEDFATLRALALNSDGLVLSPAAGDNIMLMRAFAECNVPILGKSSDIDAINAAIKHRPAEIRDLGSLVAKARTLREARALMSRIPVIDTHSDQPLGVLRRGESIGERNYQQVSLQRMEEGGGNTVFLAAYIGQGDDLSPKGCASAQDYVINLLKLTARDVEKYPEYCGLARTPEEVRSLLLQGRKAFVLAIENGWGVGDDLSRLQDYKDLGVVCMTLCHNGDNTICGTGNAKSKNGNAGLTPFGRKVVAEMNRIGLAIDLSHTSDATFRDVLELSSKPVILTHSGARALRTHARNRTDEQLRALARNGGVIQQFLLRSAMRADSANADLEDFLDQLEHCISVAGIDHVGIGMDYDGGGGSWNLNGTQDYVNVTVRLLERGYGAEQIAKLWGGNVLRVLSEVQKL